MRCPDSMKAFLALAALALLAACDVEPPDLPPLDGSFPDAQPLADGGPIDSGDAGPIECASDDECASDQYCMFGSCTRRPVQCGSTSDCAPSDRCARPLSATSTINPGLCRSAARLRGICESDSECAGGEVCTAGGYCAPEAIAVAGNTSSFCVEPEDCGPGETAAAVQSLELVASCGTDTDCGPAGLCDESIGACTACRTNADCPRELTCQDGACSERPTCSTDLHCFPANQCMSQRCVRRSNCTTDGGDRIGSAVALQAALYQELGLCSDRGVAWWSFEISGSEGARIALTSTRSEVTMVMDLFDDTGAIVDDARWLSLPGLTVVELPGPGHEAQGTAITRSLRLRVQSLDHAGRYDLDLVRSSPLCPGDALDQYGDRDPARSLPIEGNQSYLMAACPGDEDYLRIDVAAEDQLLAQATFGGSNTDLDLAAYAGTSTGADPIARGDATDTSTESLDTGRIAAAGPILLRTTPKQTSSRGQDYGLDVIRYLGTFFRACRDTADLPLAGGMASVQGDLTAAIDLGAPFCSFDLYADQRRNDLLYRITPPSAPSLLRVLITPTPESTSEITAAIVSACATGDAETRACDSAELPRRALQLEELLSTTEPVFLLISSDGAIEDMSFDLEVLVEQVTVPANNSCAGAIDIVQSGEIDVSTYGATNTVEATQAACGLFDGHAVGPDAFYRLPLGAGERAALELTGPRNGLIWIATDCGQMTSTCTTAEVISYEDPVATVSLAPANATTYFVAVDGFGPEDLGVYGLRTVLDPECLTARDCTGSLRCDDYRCVPVPANDTCTGAEPIALDAGGRATIVASTGAANDNLVPSCLERSDRDIVYRIDLPVDHSALTARIVEARFDPALAIRRAQCEASLEEVCNDDVRYPEEPNILLPEITWMQPPAGTYYVIVDAYAGSGTFTLQIEALP